MGGACRNPLVLPQITGMRHVRPIFTGVLLKHTQSKGMPQGKVGSSPLFGLPLWLRNRISSQTSSASVKSTTWQDRNTNKRDVLSHQGLGSSQKEAKEHERINQIRSTSIHFPCFPRREDSFRGHNQTRLATLGVPDPSPRAARRLREVQVPLENDSGPGRRNDSVFSREKDICLKSVIII